MSKFVPIKNHSHFSLGRAISKPEQIIKKCLELGYECCALTDTSLSGTLEFQKECKKHNIKPLVGLELKDRTLIAKNNAGWKELLRNSDVGENLICLTGEANKEYVKYLADSFGKENVFLELSQFTDIQDGRLDIESSQTLGILREIGKDLGIKCVATGNSFYTDDSWENRLEHRILLSTSLKMDLPTIETKLSRGDTVECSKFFRQDHYYIPAIDQLKKVYTEEEIENSNLLSSLCEDFSIANKPLLPKFDVDDPNEYLRQLCRNGWVRLGLTGLDEREKNIYGDRVKKELAVLTEANLSPYFLIVQDYVNWAKQRMLVGVGRGSGAGSLVSYLLGITGIDPIKYGLIFERFYNAGRNTADRVSLPDIDVDFPVRHRKNVVEYIRNKYGSEYVAQICTFQRMQGRAAVKNALRAFNSVSFDEMNNITSIFPEESKIADELQEMVDKGENAGIIRWTLEHLPQKLSNWVTLDDNGEIDITNSPLHKEFKLAMSLEGTKVSQGRHPAGVVVCAEKIADVCPMIWDKKAGEMISGYDMKSSEDAGLVKLDILATNSLDKLMDWQDSLFEDGI